MILKRILSIGHVLDSQLGKSRRIVGGVMLRSQRNKFELIHVKQCIVIVLLYLNVNV